MILSGQILVSAFAHLLLFLRLVWERASHELVSPFADLSIFSLCFALLVAVVWSARGRRRKIRVLLRGMFPRYWLSGPSARADWGFALFNRFVAGSLVAWAILSSSTISQFLGLWLTDHFGPAQAGPAPGWLTTLVATVALYLAYELAYFISHYLSHRVELLWHFHRVHHLAETLSPLTNNRVHPVDSILLYNFIGVFTGATMAMLGYFLPSAKAVDLDGTNALLILALYLLTHLQHSHIWLPLTGWTGRIVMSPAHHQIHHSDDPAHYNCNFGNSLALFDWLAQTLVAPKFIRQRLKFGAGAYAVDPHTVYGGLIQPFVEAFWSVVRLMRLAKPGQTISVTAARAEISVAV